MKSPTLSSKPFSGFSSAEPQTSASQICAVTPPDSSNVSRLPPALLIAWIKSGASLPLRVHGGSMWPALRSGAKVRIAPCRAADLAAGDVAAYHQGEGLLVVHRVISPLENGRLIFRGDALPTADAPVAEDEVLGRVHVLGQPRWHVRLPSLIEVGRLGRMAMRTLVRLWPRRWQQRAQRSARHNQGTPADSARGDG